MEEMRRELPPQRDLHERQVVVRLPTSLLKALDAKISGTKHTRSSAVRWALCEWLQCGDNW